jgi:hypothetical protein
MTPLPFVTPAWLRYLELLDAHGADFGGDDLATMAIREDLERRLELHLGEVVRQDYSLDFSERAFVDLEIRETFASTCPPIPV